MLRRLIALALLLVLSLSLTSASAAGIQYNANASLRAGVYYPDYGYNNTYSYPTSQFSSTYTPYTPTPSLPFVEYEPMSNSPLATPFHFTESPYTPGGPLLAPILNNWLYWGNAFNWLPSGNTQGYYNGYGAYNNYGPYANYINTPVEPMIPRANYIQGNSAQMVPHAEYTQPVSTTMTPQANYVASVQEDRTPRANYIPASTEVRTPVANYVPTVVEDRTPVANYVPTVTEDRTPVANYTATTLEDRTPRATYIASAQEDRTPRATYISSSTANTPASAALAENIPWFGASRSSVASSDVPLWSLERNMPTSDYTRSSFADGPAFGSLYGDGRDSMFSGSAAESFVTRLRSQTSPTYTTRAEDLSNQNYGAFFGLEPAVTYTPAPDYVYDRSFSTPNLNATPLRVNTSSGAVGQAATDTSLAAPLQRYSTYAEDLKVMESHGLGLVVEQWKKQSPERQLTRLNIMNLAIAMRLWRDTGRTPTVENLNDATLNGWRKDAQGNIRPLPQVIDIPATDSRLATVVAAAYMRVMYMPDLQVSGSQIQSFRADPDSLIERGQTLQAMMTALYLRPDATLLQAGYTDTPKNAWYAPWALTARTYGLNYGTRFEAGHKVSQEEAAYMVATLLRQLR